MTRFLNLFLLLSFVAVKNVKSDGKPNNDIVLKPKNRQLDPLTQGACLYGWVDVSWLDLGCVMLPDLFYSDLDEITAEEICNGFGEDGRLVEIYNIDQLIFLQNMLLVFEFENGLFNWWIGLNDNAEEGTFVWPSGAAANFTWWDTKYDEPQAGTNLNCVLMKSAMSGYLKWETSLCDQTIALPLCQIPQK